MFQECVVCGTRTRETVTLIRTLEAIAVCSERCRRVFLQYPLQFLETLPEASTRSD